MNKSNIFGGDKCVTFSPGLGRISLILFSNDLLEQHISIYM